MPAGDLNDGSRFGLVPIGLPEAKLSTPGGDTERRSFPGLATKSSVYAWTPDLTVLVFRSGVTGASVTDTVNMRANAATGGFSVDVPTWAAGAVITFDTDITTIGTSTYFQWQVRGILSATLSNNIYRRSAPAVGSVVNATEFVSEVVVPFYDEPVFTIFSATDGTGTSTYSVRLLGYVRNV